MLAGKILERIIACNHNDYLEANNMLNNCQHRGGCGRSTVTNLLACECHIADFMNNNKPRDFIIVDFMCVYDKVCLKILCNKIKTFGIDGCYMSWIISFLSGRLQYVEYDSVKFIAAAVSSGTIQGSAIGRILFCMFINDLCDVIKYCHKWLYVDDVKMVDDTSTQTAYVHVQLDLDVISKWSEENLLPISILKRAALHYELRTLNCQYNICGQQITAVEQCMDFVYIYVYICVYICIYICVYMCIYVYTCVYTCIHVYTCVYMCIHVYTCVYKCIHVYICVYMCINMSEL